MNKKNNIPGPDEVDQKMMVEPRGLSIEELRHRRALVLLQKEFCKEKMQFGALKLKNSSPFSKDYSGQEKPLGRAAALAGKLVGGMNYLDYAVIGFSIFRNVKKAVKIFKRK